MAELKLDQENIVYDTFSLMDYGIPSLLPNKGKFKHPVEG